MMKSKLTLPLPMLLSKRAHFAAPARNGKFSNYSSQSLPSGIDYFVSRNKITEREDQFTQNSPDVSAVSFLSSYMHNGDDDYYELMDPSAATVFPPTSQNRNAL